MNETKFSGRVCIIPARGGSKRIPRKNIRLFHGFPLIHYAISAATSSGLFDRVICSTEDEEIARIAVSSGAEAPFRRPKHLADDLTLTADVLIHAIAEIRKSQPLEYICCLYATAVFVEPHALKAGFDLMVRENASACFPVTSFPFPIMRGLYRSDDATVSMIWPEHMNTRSNDLPETFHDAGQFYWYRVDDWLRNPVIYPRDARTIVLPRYRVQDIDTLEDWDTAENMYTSLKLGLGDIEI